MVILSVTVPALLVSAARGHQGSYREAVTSYLAAYQHQDIDAMGDQLCVAAKETLLSQDPNAVFRQGRQQLGGDLTRFDVLRGESRTAIVELSVSSGSQITRHIPIAFEDGAFRVCPRDEHFLGT
jgi:hypothetical protein